MDCCIAGVFFVGHPNQTIGHFSLVTNVCFFQMIVKFQMRRMPALSIFRFDLGEKERLNSNGRFMGEPNH